MPKLDTSPYKGVRDFFPEDQFIENYIFSVWRRTVESFGFEEYGASLLEPTELYTEKSGEEIINEQTYTFKDRGDRSVTLRPEMTPTLARMVAHKRRELGLPLRWYSIPNLFRYEATQKGRLREHWQLNVDILGLPGIEADLEIVKVAYTILRNFGAEDQDFEISLNFPTGSVEELNQFKDRLASEGVTNTVIDQTLARGQAYYTGIVFEIFDTNPENSRSIFGGGRFDKLMELFGSEDVPAVGVGGGDVTMRDFLETHHLLPTYVSTNLLYIALTSLDLAKEANKVADALRSGGVNVAIDWTGRKLGDQIKTADKHKVPFVMVLGEDEVKSQMFSIKHLSTGKETKGSSEDIVKALK